MPKIITCLSIIVFLFYNVANCQTKLEGVIKIQDGEAPTSFVKVTDSSNNQHTYTDASGKFTINVNLPVTLLINADGYKFIDTIIERNNVLTLSLERDPLLLDAIIISDYHSKSNLLKSQNAITVIKDPLASSLSGISSLVSQVPGVFIDGSLGEVYTRVYARGVSASAEDNIGWYYQSLQEDGLPTSIVQYNYFSPDFFHRTDLMTSKLEAVRGGKSGVLFQNAPGGAFNFISKSPQAASNEVKTTVGFVGESNAFLRQDALFILPLKSESWSAAVSGFYRYDQGHRNTDYPWNKGGQGRAKLQKTFSQGVFTLTTKYLNDQVNRHTGLAATNWENPQAAFDQNFNSTALMLPRMDTSIPGANGYDFNSAKGIHLTDLSVQSSLGLSIQDWALDLRGKVSKKKMDWNTSFSNQPLGLESFLPYFLSGGQFPFGNIEFADINTNEVLATINNLGALNAFQGEQPTYEYVTGSLPNNALLGIAPWKKTDELNEQIFQLGLSRKFITHDLHFGGLVSHANLDYFTNASFAFATFEAKPRLLTATLLGEGGSRIALSDNQGLTNYGGLFFESGEMNVNQQALFLNDNIDIFQALSAEIGFRYENISHHGDLDIPSVVEQAGGIDGNPITDYDNGQQIASGQTQEIDFNYNYLSYSAAISYEISSHQQLHARYSNTNKAPELNYYIQNFSGLPINNPGDVQNIIQTEITYRYAKNPISISLTAFSSALKNIGFYDFVFDQQTNEIYYAPVQINNTRTNGLEAEWSFLINQQFSLRGSQTIQQSEALRYTVYNTNGSAGIADDFTTDFSGNALPHTPKLMSRITLLSKVNQLLTSLSWQHMGSRFGNVENSFTLPSFNTIDANINFTFNDKFNLGVKIENLLNSAGLMNFFGPNEFGSSANAATNNYIQNNPNASFVVFPILPRAVYLSGSYSF